MKAQINDRRYRMPRLLVRALRYGAIAALLAGWVLFSVGIAAAADPTLAVQSVSFAGAGNLTVVNDMLGAPIKDGVYQFSNVMPPQWVAGDDKGNAARAVAYVSGTQVNVSKVVFTVTNPPQVNTTVFVTASNATVGTTAPVQGTLMANAGTFTLQPANGLVFPTAFAAMQTQFFDGSGKLNPGFQIAWTYKLKNAGPQQAAGTSTNTLYVTFAAANPASTPIYRTSLKLSIPKGGDTSMDMVFMSTWGSFSTGASFPFGGGPTNVTNADGKPLYYYQPGLGFGNICSANGLLGNGDGNGQCGAWAQLFENALAINGVDGWTHITVDTSDDSDFMIYKWSDLAQGDGDPAGCDKDGVVIQFKAQWEEMVTSPGKNNTYCDYVSGQDGLSGQNSTPPSEKVFIRHFIVKYKIAGQPCYYDPSYGKTSKNEADFQENAVYGFAVQKPDTLIGTVTLASAAGQKIEFTPPDPGCK